MHACSSGCKEDETSFFGEREDATQPQRKKARETGEDFKSEFRSHISIGNNTSQRDHSFSLSDEFQMALLDKAMPS